MLFEFTLCLCRAQTRFPGYKIRSVPSAAGLESTPGIDGDKSIAESAYNSLTATAYCDEAYGGLSCGVGGSCIGNRKAAWVLMQLLNLFMFGGAAALRAAKAASNKTANRTDTADASESKDGGAAAASGAGGEAKMVRALNVQPRLCCVVVDDLGKSILKRCSVLCVVARLSSVGMHVVVAPLMFRCSSPCAA